MQHHSCQVHMPIGDLTDLATISRSPLRFKRPPPLDTRCLSLEKEDQDGVWNSSSLSVEPKSDDTFGSSSSWVTTWSPVKKPFINRSQSPHILPMKLFPTSEMHHTTNNPSGNKGQTLVPATDPCEFGNSPLRTCHSISYHQRHASPHSSSPPTIPFAALDSESTIPLHDHMGSNIIHSDASSDQSDSLGHDDKMLLLTPMTAHIKNADHLNPLPPQREASHQQNVPMSLVCPDIGHTDGVGLDKRLSRDFISEARLKYILEAQISCDVNCLNLKDTVSKPRYSTNNTTRPSRLDVLNFIPTIVEIYHKEHYINYEQVMVDGFYDIGRSASLEHLDILDINVNRETILVDANNDLRLQDLVRNAQAMLSSIKRRYDAIIKLAEFVQDTMGGCGPNIYKEAFSQIAKLKKAAQVNVIWIGELRYGLCRHRSILFKYLADRVGIQSRLIRGELESNSHAWNVVRIDGQDQILDLMVSPINLISTISTSPQAIAYHRTLQNGGLGGPGGTSILVHPKTLREEDEVHELSVLRRFWEIKEEELQYAKRNRDNVSVRVKLGQGGFGIVYLAKYRGTRVAVKRLKIEDPDEAMLREFRKEVSLLMRLRHPNIVLLLGANIHPPSMMIVTEYVEKHDLKKLIERKDSLAKWEAGGKRIALDIAVALCFLHGSNILHLDIKSLNILIGRGGVAKLADVGLARTRKHASTRLEEVTTQALTIAWASPEQLNGDKIGPSSDIYSFGICMWEIVTQQTPWDKCDMRTIIGNVIQGRTLPWPEGNDNKPLESLIQSCWNRDPRARPTAEQLVEVLETMQ